MERFALDVNVECGGLSSLRATAAPSLESDVGGAALLPSIRRDFAGLRRIFAGFRLVIAGKLMQIQRKFDAEAYIAEISDHKN